MVLESGSWLEYKGIYIYIFFYNTPPPPLYSENGGDNKINEE